MQRCKLRGHKTTGAERKEMVHSGAVPKPVVIIDPVVIVPKKKAKKSGTKRKRN